MQDVKKLRALARELVRELVKHNTGSMYGGGHGFAKPHQHSCGLCEQTWKPKKPERHKPGCVIGRAIKALRLKPRVIPLRPL